MAVLGGAGGAAWFSRGSRLFQPAFLPPAPKPRLSTGHVALVADGWRLKGAGAPGVSSQGVPWPQLHEGEHVQRGAGAGSSLSVHLRPPVLRKALPFPGQQQVARRGEKVTKDAGFC